MEDTIFPKRSLPLTFGCTPTKGHVSLEFIKQEYLYKNEKSVERDQKTNLL